MHVVGGKKIKKSKEGSVVSWEQREVQDRLDAIEERQRAYKEENEVDPEKDFQELNA